MKILGVETKYFNPEKKGAFRTSAVDWWRIINPLKHLQKKTNWEIEIRKGILSSDNLTQEEVDREYETVGKSFDVVFTGYHGQPLAHSYLMVLSKRYGLKYVFDIDDDVFSINQYNPVFQDYQKRLFLYKTIIQDVSYITTTNTYLKQVLKRERGRGGITVLPNCIDLNLYKTEKHIEDDVITIVYAGGNSHAGDVLFSEFHTAMVYLLGKYQKKIKFQIVGFIPGTFFNELPNVEYIKGTPDFYEWIKLYQRLSPYWDIGVAPLEDNEFNKSKSNIKVQEYASAFIPTVASPVGPYLSIIKDGKNGFFALSVKEWINKLEMLINDKKRRLTLGEKIYNEVKEKWTIDKNIDKWINYFSILTNEKK